MLVIIELNGGNDGINTVVPFRDDGYARHRKVLRLPEATLIRVGDGVGLNPAMASTASLLDSGQLAIVQGVGYPNPSRSHFQSLATWQTARTERSLHDGPGWLGPALESQPSRRAPMPAFSIGTGLPPVALRGLHSSASCLDRLEDSVLDAGADPRRILPPGRAMTTWPRTFAGALLMPMRLPTASRS